MSTPVIPTDDQLRDPTWVPGEAPEGMAWAFHEGAWELRRAEVDPFVDGIFQMFDGKKPPPPATTLLPLDHARLQLAHERLARVDAELALLVVQHAAKMRERTEAVAGVEGMRAEVVATYALPPTAKVSLETGAITRA